MRNEVREQLALIYVKKNLQPGDSPEKAVELYSEADETIRKYEGEHHSWSL